MAKKRKKKQGQQKSSPKSSPKKQQVKQSKKVQEKQSPPQQKLIPQQEEVKNSASVTEKFNHNRGTVILLGTVLVLVLMIVGTHVSTVKEQSNNAWQLLGAAINFTGQHAVLGTTVDDLTTEIHRELKLSIKDPKALPENLQVSDVNNLELEKLPKDLAKTVLREHYLIELQKILPEVKNTTAAPWTYYTIANLYMDKGEIDSALDFYEVIRKDYPNHFLITQTLKNIQTIFSQEQSVKRKMPEVPIAFSQEDISTQVTVITNQGTFDIGLYDKVSNKAVGHFLSLVKANFYNGLVFYRNTPMQIHSGCPLANGFGGSGKEIEAEVQEGYLQRGLVVMEYNEDATGKIDSRFYIVKKYPMEAELSKFTIIGEVNSQGMEVVDKLKNRDVLLDVSVAGATN